MSAGGRTERVDRAVVWKEKVIRSGEEMKCNYEEGSDPDPCNFKVMKCLASEHKQLPLY